MIEFKKYCEVIVSGRLEINGQQDIGQLLDYEYNHFDNEIERNKVDIVVYKTPNKHFAVIYPPFDPIRHICCINLKTSVTTVMSGENKHELHIKSNNDFDKYDLVLKVEAKDQKTLRLWANAFISEDNSTPIGSYKWYRKRSISRESSLEMVDEEEEFC